MLRVLCFAVILFWTARGHVGTYGGYTLEKSGYGIHKSISVGYHSDHKREAEIYKKKEEAAKKDLAAFAPDAQRIFDHFLNAKHPYQVDAEVFDRTRTKEAKDDYKYRHQITTVNGKDTGTTLALYLYFKKDFKSQTPNIRVRKAMANFVLSQFAKGGHLEGHKPTQAKLLDPEALAQDRIPQSNFADYNDFAPWIGWLNEQVFVYVDAISALDISKIEKPDSRIFLYAIRALHSQTKLPKEVETDLALISDSVQFAKMASVVWFFSRADEWPEWKSKITALFNAKKIELDPYLI